jgi:DNA-binding transcriptional ArsR family regulator
MLADGNRSTMLLELLDGRALPASELASRARISRPLASMHLAKLEASGLVHVEPNGRHRYYRLASGELASALEVLSALSPAPEPSGGLREYSAHEALRYARSCYDHLAGELGVQVTERLLERRALERVEGGFAVTEAGAELLAAYGIDVVELARRRRAFCRACLDWTERRHHLAGSVGAALLSRFLEDRLLRRLPTSRALVMTAEGSGVFGREWGIEVL